MDNTILCRFRLRTHTLNNFDERQYSRAVEFIETGLRNNHPVILFVTYNDYIKTLPVTDADSDMVEEHFVTITGINRKRVRERVAQGESIVRGESTIQGESIISERFINEEEDCELIISNWGHRGVIPSLRGLWNSKNSIKVEAMRVLSLPFNRNFASVSLAYYSIVNRPPINIDPSPNHINSPSQF